MCRRVLLATLVAAAGILATPAVLAQATTPAATDASWPSRPVRILFGFPAASATDVIARAVGQKLSEKWGQPVVIENRPGAGGNLGSALAASAPPDGYTIFFGTVANAISATLYTKLNYDYLKDFVPITLVAATPLVLVANNELPVKDVPELVAHAKSHPGTLNFGSGGVGTSNHLAGELFKTASGTDLQHIPYKGTPAAHTDLMGGRIALMWDNIVAVSGHIKAGRVKPLAVTGAERAPSLPQTPTMAESGVDVQATSWIGALVPTGTPQPIVDRIYQDLIAVLRMPEVRDQLAQTGAIVVGNTPAEFAAWNREEIAKWAKAVRSSGAKID